MYLRKVLIKLQLIFYQLLLKKHMRIFTPRLIHNKKKINISLLFPPLFIYHIMKPCFIPRSIILDEKTITFKNQFSKDLVMPVDEIRIIYDKKNYSRYIVYKNKRINLDYISCCMEIINHIKKSKKHIIKLGY